MCVCVCVLVCVCPLPHTTTEQILKCRNRKLDLKGSEGLGPSRVSVQPCRGGRTRGGGKEKTFIHQLSPFFLSSIHLPIQALPVSSLTSPESRTKAADCRQSAAAWPALWMDNRCNVKQDTTKSVLECLAVREHVVVMRPEPLETKKRFKVK